MSKTAIALAAALALAGAGLAGCHNKNQNQPTPAQQMKQGAHTMGQGMKAAGKQAGQAASDTAITTKVKAKLAGNQGLSSFNIHVETDNGVVTLTGTVATTSEHDTAGRIAKNTDGVKGVNNNIVVQGQGG
ncbi:MAG: BON domain-containing protein [Gammaproteobacteria bacterium]